jgi:dTDP-4-dehydrorhamnose reductase
MTLGAVTAADAGQHLDPSVRRLDLSKPDEISRIVAEVAPSLIVNAAAYTDVESAEDNPDTAHLINAQAPGILAELAQKTAATFVHYSTDYVFDGASTVEYGETDAPNPISIYGESKLAGEQSVVDIGGKYIILRTSWLYAARGQNFLLKILQRARSGEPLRVVNDQVGSPTWARALAETTAQIIAQSQVDDADYLVEKSGIYHATASGKCSWYEFTQKILKLAGDEEALSRLSPVSTSAFQTKATRPAHSVLNCGKLQRTFGLSLGHWEEQLARVMEERGAGVA